MCCQRKCKLEGCLWREICPLVSRALKTFIFSDLTTPFIKISHENTSDKHLRVFTAALFKKEKEEKSVKQIYA